MDHREFENQFATEARRLRLNPYRLDGLAGGGTDWEEPLLAHMRALEPGVSWEDVFPGHVDPEFEPHLAELIASFDANPDAYWNERDRQAVDREFHRVVLTHLTNSVDLDNGLRALRSLPDNAGWDAFQQALRTRAHAD